MASDIIEHAVSTLGAGATQSDFAADGSDVDSLFVVVQKLRLVPSFGHNKERKKDAEYQ